MKLYEQALFGDPLRLETASGAPRCRCAVPWHGGQPGFDQCKRRGVIQLPDGVWVCVTHDPRAAMARARQKAARGEAAAKRERLNLIAPRMLEALRAIAHGCDDPAGRARRALGNLAE